MVSVKVVNISKRFGETIAVDHINLDVKEGELVTLLGPSGCGKTTTLRIIAGLVKPDTGEVYFGDTLINPLPPYKRNIGLVFQRIALFPHMNVFNNVAFGLKMRGYAKEEIRRKVEESLELVHMQGLGERMPRQLSGGQAQRVEIARVLSTDPDVLLFDEPLSNLDAKLRDELKYEIRRIQKETEKSSIFVTHDQSEAFAISDRIYVMNNGRIEQIGTPLELYLKPDTPFIADFIGTSNFLKGEISSVDPSQNIMNVKCDNIVIHTPYSKDFSLGDGAIVCIRPEDIDTIVEEKRATYLNVLRGKINKAIFTGLTTRVESEVNGIIFKVDIQGPERFQFIGREGKKILLGFNRCNLVKIRS